jgi:uncharacterized membrane protein (Fun14 family)
MNKYFLCILLITMIGISQINYLDLKYIAHNVSKTTIDFIKSKVLKQFNFSITFEHKIYI